MEFNERELLILSSAMSDRIFCLNSLIRKSMLNGHLDLVLEQKLKEAHDLQNKILGVE